MLRHITCFALAFALWSGGIATHGHGSTNTDTEAGEQESSNSLLPQNHPHQVTIYNWLSSLSVSDVATQGLGDVTYSSDGASNDELYKAYLSLRNREAPPHVLRWPDNQFVLDDGSGNGFEADGTTVRTTWTSTGDGRRPLDQSAWWVTFHIPGISNPYYDNDNAKRKILAQAAVDLLMLEEYAENETNFWGDFGMNYLRDISGAFNRCRDVLPENVQHAFVESFIRIIDRWQTSAFTYPRPVNENMSSKGIPGLVMVAELAEEYGRPDDKQDVLEYVRDVLFGAPNGIPDDSDGREDDILFDSAGYQRENGGPHTTYNGVSFYYFTKAAGIVNGKPEWDFLWDEGGIVDRMAKYYMLQHFPEPIDQSGELWYKAPTGYSTRLDDHIVGDQSDGSGRDALIAIISDHGKPFLTRPRRSDPSENYLPLPASEMESEIQSGLNLIDFDPQSVSMREWDYRSQWSARYSGVIYDYYKEGTYDAFQSLADTDDPLLQVPYSRQEGFSEGLGRSSAPAEWWMYKANDGTRDFGFLIEMTQRPGRFYTGGGAFHAFWTEDVGPVILSVKPEGHSTQDLRPISGIWGENESGDWIRNSALDFDSRQGDKLQVVDGLDQSPPYLQQLQQMDDVHGAGYDVQVEVTATALSDGLEMRHVITSHGTNELSELWASIPVHHRHSWQNTDVWTDIEYWDGSNWQELSTMLVSTEYLRLSKTFTDGTGHVYVELDQARGVHLSAQDVNQRNDFGGNSAFWTRNVHIDLHGNPGTMEDLPDTMTTYYSLRTNDPTSDDSPSPGEQELMLEQGWNIASLSVEPEDREMEAVLADVLEDIELVKNVEGNVFFPAEGINDIGDWQLDEAYWIYAKDDVSFAIVGEDLEPSSTLISLSEGWHLVPYIGNVSTPVEEALESVSDHLIVLRDSEGKVFFPGFNIDEIAELQPGRGFLLYVDEASTLVYPSTIVSGVSQ